MDVRLMLADGVNLELFDADYEIFTRADNTPSDIAIYNAHARYTIPAFRVELLEVTSGQEVRAYMRADRYTIGRANDGSKSPVKWGWYTGTDW